MEELLRMLLALTAGGTLLATVLMLLQRLMKSRLPASFAYYAWLLVLLRFVLPLPGLLPTAEPHAADAPMPVVTAWPVEQVTTPYAPRTYSEGSEQAGLPAEDVLPVSETAGAKTAKPAVDIEALLDGAKTLLTSWDFWGLVYLIGVGISFLWYAVGYLRFRRALGRTFRPARESDRLVLEALNPNPWPALCRSRALRTPMLLGFLRPVIVLPERDYDEGMLRGILRHELTHYRRGDLAFKWFAVLVSCLHWFNPFLALFRREIDRACELSCDERLLRRMGRDEKQHYGELLLTLAADRPLPGSVVAVSFATEKRNLKERLLQIMKYKNKGRAGIALALIVLLLLSGCGMALGPNSGALPLTGNAAAETPSQPTPSVIVTPSLFIPGPGESPIPVGSPDDVTELYGDSIPEEHIIVRSVDEFIAAIGSDRVIQIPDGVFNLTAAASYGGDTGNEAVRWKDIYEGYELVIHDVENLYIAGHGKGMTEIVTEPRYANVLSFENCAGVNLISFTAGHTVLPGYCTGGVLNFSGCDSMVVTGCDLYGCGTLGIYAINCRGVAATATVIRECSVGAVHAVGCWDVRFVGGQVRDCGLKGDAIAADLFHASTTTGFVVFNTEICGNEAQTLLHTDSSLEVQMRGCDVHDNRISREPEAQQRTDGSVYTWATGGLFHIGGASPVFDDCRFVENTVRGAGMYFNYDGESNAGVVVNAAGRELALSDLEAMQRKEYLEPYYGPHQPEAAAPAGEQNELGENVFHVDNVDDFLAAIGSDTTIYVDCEQLDFSTAANYGGYGGNNYYWRADFDGPNLIITDVENFHIIGQGKDRTTLQAVPRYAEVLNFENCSDISVENLTAGHLKEAPGSCAGDVFEFTNCGEILVRGCGLFGCGVNAIYASNCQGLTVEDTEMYECSNLGAQLMRCSGVSFTGCEIHDCAYNSVYLGECSNVLWDGAALHEGNNNLG